MCLTPAELKEKYFNCWCVLHASKYFWYHQFKVQGDKEFIKQLVKSGDFVALAFMEEFYKELRRNSDTQKDIMSRKDYLEIGDYSEL